MHDAFPWADAAVLTQRTFDVIGAWLAELPSDADELLWLTYNVHLTRRVTELLAQMTCRTCIIVCNSGSTTDGRRFVRAGRQTWQALHGPDTPLRSWELRGIPGLHAKGLIARRNGKVVAALLGSFNLSDRSLTRNWETAVSLTAAQRSADFDRMVEECVAGWFDVGKEHLTRSEGSGPGGQGFVPQPLSDEERGALSARRTSTLVERCRALLVPCRERLKNWPPDHPKRTYQHDIVDTLLEATASPELGYDRWLLHLPVGLGKTYIALTYALEVIVERQRKPHILYLTPNQWVTRSVEQACKGLRLPEGLVSVSHPQGVHSLGRPWTDFGVFILDEVHNWAAVFSRRRPMDHTRFEPGSETTYTDLVECVLQHNAASSERSTSTSVLGLSGTPCRLRSMDSGTGSGRARAYRKEEFIPRFLAFKGPVDRRHEAHAKEVGSRLLDPCSGWTLRRAFDQKLLSEPEVVPLDAVRLDTMQAFLSRNGDKPYAFGDWSDPLLAAWLEALGGLPGADAVADLIAERLMTSRGPGKGIVFLPVGCAAVRTHMRRRLEQRLGRGAVYNVTSDGGSSKAAVDAALEDFEAHAGGPAVLLAVNRLTEGVSFTDVDALFMLRPTRSPLIVMQQVGRGVRLHNGQPKRLMVYDLAQVQEAWELLLSQQGGPDEGRPAASEVAARTPGDVLGQRARARTRGPTVVEFQYNGDLYPVQLSVGDRAVRVLDNHTRKELGTLRYQHAFADGRWTLTPKSPEDAWRIVISEEKKGWKARVEDQGKPTWRPCQVIE